MHSNTFEKIDGLVKKRGEKGIILLLIFKSVQREFLEQLEQGHPEINWDEGIDKINRECINLSKKILSDTKENPTEKEIGGIVKKIHTNISQHE